MSTYQSILRSIVTEAGEIIMTYRNVPAAVSTKQPEEIVTPADIAANDYIVKSLGEAFPSIPIYSEEGSGDKSEAATRWIVDPLDGTTPWVWGNSGFSVSIALEEHGQIVVGAIYDPVMKELYYAEKGAGATKNNIPISPVDCPVQDMFMVVDWGNANEQRKQGLAYLEKLMLPEMFARRIVPQFAPALGLCRIAEGRIHALVCNDTWVEDHAAGSLILHEAGGYLTNFSGTTRFDHRTPGIIATNNRDTYDAIVHKLKS